MKAAIAFLAIIVAFAGNSHQIDMMKIITTVKDTCMKKTGANEAQIMELMFNSDYSTIDPPPTEGAKCFFQCPFGMAMMLKPNGCFDCNKAKKALNTFMKGEDMKELKEALVSSMDTCGPTLQEDDCCRQNYDLVYCIYQNAGETVMGYITGMN